jgi:hypothetical protein
MQKIAPILLTILLAGISGFAIGIANAGLTDRIVASSAIKAKGCEAFADQKLSFGADRYVLSLDAVGPDCARAIAVVVLRDGAGAPVFSTTYPLATLRQASGGPDPYRGFLADAVVTDGPPAQLCLAPVDGAQTCHALEPRP